MTRRLELAAAPAQLGPAEAEELAGALRALVATLRTPLRVWHGPRAAARGRPRATWVSGAEPPALPAEHPLLRLREDPLGPALPAATAERHDRLALAGGGAGRLLALAAWPAAVSLDWLAGLAAHPAVAATVLFLQPLTPASAARLLRRRRTALAAERVLAERAGRVPGPEPAQALATVTALHRRLAAGETALVRARLLVAVAAARPDGLAAAARAAGAAAAAGAQGARLAPVPFEQRPGWAGLLGSAAAAGRPGPGGRWRVLDAASAALCLPLPAPAFACPEGEPAAGEDPATGAEIRLDRFALANPGRLVVGASGAGKSYAAKLEVTRWAARGADVLVIDPEGEFTGLAGPPAGRAAPAGPAGVVVRRGIDPVALASGPLLPGDSAAELLAGTVAALLGAPLSSADLALLDAALARLRARGVSDLAGLGRQVAALARRAPFAGSDLPARLAPASAGRLGRYLAADPRLDRPPPLVVADLRGTPEPVRPAVAAGLLGWAWARAARTPAGGAPQLVVVDEAHLLLADPHSAAFLASFARRARKYRVALDVVTQRLSDFLDSPAGRAVLDSSATRLLLGVAEPERGELARALGLTPGEAALLAPGRPGRGLLCSPRGRLAVQVVANPAEQRVVAGTGR